MESYQHRRAIAWRRILAVSFVALTFIIMFISTDLWSTVKEYTPEVPSAEEAMDAIFSAPRPDILKDIASLWAEDVHSLTDDHYTTDRGRKYEIPEHSYRWDKPMKEKILIVDIDTRLDTSEGAMLGDTSLNRDNIKPRTAGILNHFLYSLIHGYDYRVIRAPEATDRHGTWVKVPIMKEAVKEYDIVVFLDSDAVFQQLDLPFEWLLTLWNVTDQTLAAMPEDPNSEVNQDSRGWVLWNTGFVVTQRSERTQELFEAWDACPTGVRYPDCQRWAYDWAHEQRAMGEFLRYDFNATDELRVISCMDGNGAEYIEDKRCGGVFVSHHWGNKDATKDDLYSVLSDDLVDRLHRGFVENKEHYFRDWSEFTYPLEGVPSLL